MPVPTNRSTALWYRAQRSALRHVLEHLGTGQGSNQPTPHTEKPAESEFSKIPSSPIEPISQERARLEEQPAGTEFLINVAALEGKPDASHIVCIDFGTAKSKAFARRVDGNDISAEDLFGIGFGANRW